MMWSCIISQGIFCQCEVMDRSKVEEKKGIAPITKIFTQHIQTTIQTLSMIVTNSYDEIKIRLSNKLLYRSKMARIELAGLKCVPILFPSVC